MNKLSNILSLTAFAIIAGLVALNWSSLMIPAPLNLGLAQVQAPLGVVVLGVAVVLIAVFFVAYLHSQIATLMETRKLHKEIQRMHEEVQRMQALADKAEASSMENLHQLIATEFRLLNEQLKAGLARPPADPQQDGKKLSLTEMATGRAR